MLKNEQERGPIQVPEGATLYVGFGDQIVVRQAFARGFALHTLINERGEAEGRPLLAQPPIPDELIAAVDAEFAAQDAIEATGATS